MATIASRKRAASRITTPASMFIRFSAACWRVSSRKCGNNLDIPRNFISSKPPRAQAASPSHILDFAQAKLPEFYQALHYVAVERSPARCDPTGCTPFFAHRAEGAANPPWKCLQRFPLAAFFRMSLLDALPVHRVIQQDGTLQEIFVASDGATFSEVRMPLSTCAIAEYFAAQGIN